MATLPRIHVADVPALRGPGWIGGGFGIFRRQPLAWTGLAIGWLVITFALFLVPFVGGVVANFLQPVFFASFALAARKQTAGGRVEMGDLFLGFHTHLRSLVNLGALLLFAEIVIFALLALIGLPMAGANEEGLTSFADYAKELEGKEWILLLGLALTVAVKGAVWFAPPLIAFHGLSTTHALRWSLYAALSNFGALTLYGVVLVGLFVVAILPWGLGLLLALPVMAASTYAGYREVFGDA